MHPANTYFHFSFANYYDPKRMRFGALRVFNDDDISPRNGFGRHPHRDMQIISYVIRGKLTHWDSVTNKQEAIGRGHVQAISAGTGLWHSEMNAHDEWCRFLQIWILPEHAGGPVRYEHQAFEPEARANTLLHIVGGQANKGKAELSVNADVNLYVSEIIDKDTVLTFELKAGRQAYINCIEGSVQFESQGVNADSLHLDEKDTLELKGEHSLLISSRSGYGHVIIIEMQAE
jgi:redox-sensitive bicupin YhaK (pirin superfamily)